MARLRETDGLKQRVTTLSRRRGPDDGVVALRRRPAREHSFFCCCIEAEAATRLEASGALAMDEKQQRLVRLQGVVRVQP